MVEGGGGGDYLRLRGGRVGWWGGGSCRRRRGRVCGRVVVELSFWGGVGGERCGVWWGGCWIELD